MDIVSISALMNIIWYIFTMMFVLYKFTTFFNRMKMIYGIGVKAKSGITWLKNKILGTPQTQGYGPINTEEVNYYVQESQPDYAINLPFAYSEFTNEQNEKERKTEKRKRESEESVTESNMLLELGMFLPFYNKKEKIDEEIPLMESNYLDAKDQN